MRYAILADIHANAAALNAIEADVQQVRLEDEAARRALTQYWFLGDLVGYGPDPLNCVKWLRLRADIAQRWVPGNHDEYLQSPKTYLHANQDGKPVLHEDARQTLLAHLALLDEPRHRRDRDWFVEQVSAFVDESRPSLLTEVYGALTIAFTHAATAASMRRTHYVYPWCADDIAIEFAHIRQQIALTETTILFCGHTHYPMWVKEGNDDASPVLQSMRYGKPMPLGQGLMIINPGSVGQPRDGDPRAAYAILDTEAGAIEFRRVAYKIEEATHGLWGMQSVADSVRANLVQRLETANGGDKLEHFKTVYRRPVWDLEAINNGG